MTKLEVGLWDDSGSAASTCVDMTLWNEKALESYTVGSVVFLKDARIGEWNGNRSLSSPSVLEMTPDHPEASEILRRYEEVQHTRPLSAPTRSYASASSGQTKSIEMVKQEDMQLVFNQPGQQGGPRGINRHSTVATITSLPADRCPCYP